MSVTESVNKLLDELEFVKKTDNTIIKLKDDEVTICTKEMVLWFMKKKKVDKKDVINEIEKKAADKRIKKPTKLVKDEEIVGITYDYNDSIDMTLKSMDQMDNGVMAYNFFIDHKLGGTITIISPLFKGWNKGDKFEFQLSRKKKV